MRPSPWPGILTPIVALSLALAGQPAAAFDINGSKWPGGSTEFYVALSGVAATGVPFDTAFIEALTAWNSATDFNFVIRREYRNPCVLNSVNSVDFTDDVCGSAFGENTLAVTVRDWETEILGPPRFVRADVVVNRKVAYNVYDGNLVQIGIPRGDVDFRRVALHELGHVVGLDHSSASQAIMRATIGNTFTLQADDIDGVNTLYGGLRACAITPLAPGTVENTLGSGDCTVRQLTVGGNDDSFIDVYEVDLPEAATLDLTMRGAALDSVIVLADADLRFLDVDDNSGGNCDARLTKNLPAGRYLVLANTWDTPNNNGCTNTGPYTLSVTRAGTVAATLGSVTSTLGGSSRARFSGGVSAAGGQALGTRFRNSEALDIQIAVEVDPAHVGLDGFLVVAVQVDGVWQLLDDTGTLRPFTGDLLPFQRRTLQAREVVQVVEDWEPRRFGIERLSAQIRVGYGVQTQPLQVFYHSDPILLEIEP